MEILPFIVVACVSGSAIFYNGFDDNLLQRVGLSGMCFGASLRLIAEYLCISGNPGVGIMAYGLAIYAVGTVFKFRKLRHK